MSAQRPERLLAIIIVLGLTAAIVLAVVLLQGPAGSVASSSEPGALPADTERATVVHVSDGDTIVVEINGATERVRYVGLDAPEIAHPDEGTAAECGGDDARASNLELVAGLEVALERDVSDRDRFGRLLRHVWVADSGDWLLVGERLIESGAVEARTYRPDTFRDAEFDAVERRARESDLGIWGDC